MSKFLVGGGGGREFHPTQTWIVTPDIEFTDEAVLQCDVPVIKILL